MSKRLEAIELLAHGQKVTDVSKAIEVSRACIYKWMRSQDFIDEVTVKRSEYLGYIANRLVSVSNEAVDYLGGVIRGDKVKDKDAGLRVRACAIVLDKVMSLVELIDLDRRISVLEQVNKR